MRKEERGEIKEVRGIFFQKFLKKFVLRKKHCIFATSIIGAVFGFDGVQGRHVSMQGHVTTPLKMVTEL